MPKNGETEQSTHMAVHRGPRLSDIFPKLNNVKYLSLTDASSWYHNLSSIRDHNTLQLLHVNLADTDT